ncbi:MAG: hypothetical protein JOZ47_02500 [Kutzneria sp.]|nr:hypothetical protein [Kutzneria sp.]
MAVEDSAGEVGRGPSGPSGLGRPASVVVGMDDLLTVMVLTVMLPPLRTVDMITDAGIPSIGGWSPPSWSSVGRGLPPRSTVPFRL